MNKKQLIALLSAIVIATQKAADSVMETTEDEARTLVGMQLRKAARQIVADAGGVEPEEAATLLKAAQDEVAKATADKKAAKTAKTATADDAS